MAEEQVTARLDRAGTLQASIYANVVHEKITIRGFQAVLEWTFCTDLPGHEPDYSACTFCLYNEDHTLGNALRWMIMKDPDVEFCGYSAPHPSETKIHLRVQMYDNLSAVECLRKALRNLRDLLNTVNDKYSHSLTRDNYVREQDVDVRAVVRETLRQRGFGEDEAMDTTA